MADLAANVGAHLASLWAHPALRSFILMTGTFAVTKLYDQHVHLTGSVITGSKVNQNLLQPPFDIQILEEQQLLADSIMNEGDLAALSLPAPNILVPDIWGHPNTLCFTPSQPWNQAKRLYMAEVYVQTNPFIGLFALLASILVLGITGWFVYACCYRRKSYLVDKPRKREGVLSNLTFDPIPPHSRSSTTPRNNPPSTPAVLLPQSRDLTVIPDKRSREQNLPNISPSPLENAAELRKKIQKLEIEKRDMQALARETWGKYKSFEAERYVALRARDEAIDARESTDHVNDDLRYEVQSLRAQLDVAFEWTDTHEDTSLSDLEKTQANLRQAHDENKQLRMELEGKKATQSSVKDLTQELDRTRARRELKNMTARVVEADDELNDANRTVEESNSKLTESLAQLDEECTKTKRLQLDLTSAHDEVSTLNLQTKDGRGVASDYQPNQDKDIQNMSNQSITPAETSVVTLPSPILGVAANLNAGAPTFTPGNAKLERSEPTKSQTNTVGQFQDEVKGIIWCDICGNGFVDHAKFQFTKNHLPACRKWKANYERAYFIRRTDKGKIDIRFPPQYWTSHTLRPKKDPSWLVIAKAKHGELSQEKS
ncbi:hypothetical protein N0V94_000551 [Neodidymelliopsis sp. IMI 364377]|nr:hypothetical protein N0V94_000551 [Neodidymelliopsis sp. IMI 364377]